MLEAVVAFFQTGGQFMYLIAMVLTIGLVIALERWLFLSNQAITNSKAIGKIMACLDKNDMQQLQTITKSTKAFAGRLVQQCVLKSRKVSDRADLESVMEEELLEVSPRLQKRTQYLATLANIATLLGLLGTIIGLIAAFTAVANADPAEKASLLSQSISVAMNTTAFGLMTAIPLLLFHAVLQNKATRVLESLQMVGVRCVNTIRQSQSK